MTKQSWDTMTSDEKIEALHHANEERLMKEMTLNRWIEQIKTSLITLTLLGSLVAIVFHGTTYIRVKSAELQTRVDTIQRLTETYATLIKGLEEETENTDKKICKEVPIGTATYNRLLAFRTQKLKDRHELLETLGRQIVEIQKPERPTIQAD